MNDFPRGVFCAALTPLAADGSPDGVMLADHCTRLLADGCDGVALLGTTGEANSFDTDERTGMLESVLQAGIAPDRVLPGTGVAALPATVRLTRHALSLGVTRVVMLPPFYYKDVTDDGLFAAYSEVIETLGDGRLRIVLYHIPQISGMSISLDLIGRLAKRYPGTIAGVKDSSGDQNNMRAIVDRFPQLSLLAGADPLMLPMLRHGGASCITATTNLLAREMAFIYRHHADPDMHDRVDAAQARVTEIRALVSQWPQMAALKAAVGYLRGAPDWNRLRAPLMALDGDQRAALEAELAKIDWKAAL